ncbi:chemotaxis response regulator protein-glutamate methylesterase [bacterium]|nr:chemotaxis response regulator protein-glutamate methylesterase [bacterium]
MIRVIVVDDSAFMRVAIRKMIEEDSEIEVVDVARNGQEALEKIRQHRPDLVTMDIEMPVMTGLEALEQIMKEMPTPVIMISALTEEGAQATFRALELGAVDFIPKGGKSYINLDIVKISEQLRQKVRAIVTRNRLKKLTGKSIVRAAGVKSANNTTPVVLGPSGRRRRAQLVTLGISTGGPLALNHMLPQLPESFSSSILIVQHMPPAFTGPFAKRLNGLCQINVKEVEDGDIVEPGWAYVSKGGYHSILKNDGGGRYRIMLSPEPADKLFIPSVDVMKLSVSENYSGSILGVIMTGMGNDGLEGMKKIKAQRGITMAQDESSCVVYGMPKVCVDEGIIDHVVPLDQLAVKINEFAG